MGGPRHLHLTHPKGTALTLNAGPAPGGHCRRDAFSPNSNSGQVTPTAFPTSEPHRRGALQNHGLGGTEMPAADPQARGARLSLPKPPDHSSPGNPPGGGRAGWGPCDGVYIYSALRKEQVKLQLLNENKQTKKEKETKHTSTGEQRLSTDLKPREAAVDVLTGHGLARPQAGSPRAAALSRGGDGRICPSSPSPGLGAGLLH